MQINATLLQLSRFCPGLSGWASTRRNIHPLTPILITSSIILYLLHLLWSMASSLISLCAWQSLCTAFVSKSSLVCLLVWHLPLHTPNISLPSQSSFHRICPYRCNLFCCNTEIMSSNPSLSLNSFTLMPHVHLTILISACLCATSFVFLQGICHFRATYYFAHNDLPLTISDISL